MKYLLPALLAAWLAPSIARADEPSPQPAPSRAPARAGSISCALGDHAVIDDADAKTATEIVCSELEKGHAPPGHYTVSFGKLGSKISVAVARDETGESQRVFLAGIEETTVAAPRIANAFATGRPVAETVTADTVTADESRVPKTKAGQTVVVAGIEGTMGAGVSSIPSAGAFVRLLYRAGALGLTGEGRLGGVGSASDKIAHGDLGLGAQLYLSDGDIAPYIGAGVDFGYVMHVRSGDSDPSGSGFGAYTEFGVEFMRTHRMGGIAALRTDLPFYRISGGTSADVYVAPISLNIGLVFR